MTSSEFIQRALRRFQLLPSPVGVLSLICWRLRGARLGKGTKLPPRILATWPHQVKMGCNCILQPDIFFNYDHYWSPGPSIIIGDRVFVGRGCEFNIRGHLEIGDDCLIASNCTFIDHDHGRNRVRPMNVQEQIVRPIVVGKNVWIGAKSVILKGVTVGDNAIIAAGTILTKSVPAGEIWAGPPARHLSTVRA